MSNKIAILQGQVAVEQAYVTYFDARIRTGAYKDRIVHHGSHDGPLLSEEELLKSELGYMHNHIRRMNELVEAMMDSND